MRRLPIELARAADVVVHRRMLSVEDLLQADEVFLTNSNWFVLPVTRVEKKAIADGVPGPITLQLRTALLEVLRQETQ